MARTITGIDVGSRTAKIVRGQYKGNTFHASGFAVATQDARAAGAWEGLDPGFKLGASRVGLTGRDVNIRYVRVPRVPDWQLRNLMRFEVAEIGDQSGSEVASDFNLLPELPEIEGEDVVVLAMARERLLEDHERGLAALGGKLDSFTPCSLALYNAWVRYGVVEDDTVLVANIGHENVDVVIARGADLLFARNLTGGSKLFDDAIAERLGVSAKQAEKLKIDMASLRPGVSHPTANHERVSRALLGAAGQLLSLLQSTVLFCKSQVKIPGLKLDRVLLCGGGAALDGLSEYLAAGMGVRVELFDPFRVVDTSALAPDEADQLEEYKLESVVALGLATMGSDPEGYSVEILPQRVARRREFLGGTLWLIAAAVLAVAYLGFDAFQKRQQLAVVSADLAGVNRQLGDAQRTHSSTGELVQKSAGLREVALELQNIAGTGEQTARMFAFMQESLPRDFWLTRLTGAPGSEPELGIDQSIDRPILTLAGRAREGTASPAVLWQGFLNELTTAMPNARINPSFAATGDTFTLDFTLFSTPLADELGESGDTGDTGEPQDTPGDEEAGD